MVEKKKTSSTKKTDKKTNSTKKHTKVEHSSKTVNKKETKATKHDTKKNHAKKVEKSETSHPSEIVKKETSNNNVVIITVLSVLVLVLLLGIGYLLMTQSSNQVSVNNKGNNDNNNQVSTNTSINSSTNTLDNTNSNEKVILTVIEDPTCTTCGVDDFTKQVKDSLIKNLQVKKVSIASTEGKAAVKSLGLNQVPAYLFSSNIDKRSDWATKLASAFVKKELNGVSYYMLNPQYVPSKVMINEPKILDNAIVYGNKSAKVTIYEFSDYECPFCGIAEGNAALDKQFEARQPGYVAPMPEVYKNYIDTGKVKLVFYNMPLTQLHPKVRPAHIATLCANEQGKWHEFHNYLYMNRSFWVGSADYNVKMREIAKQLGLDTTKFDACLTSGKFDKQLDNELAYGASLGVSGTPAFFIDKNFISGAQNYSTFKILLDAELAKVNS